jgi:hypothetical protein
MNRARLIVGVGAALVTAGVATADWFPGDPFKMHYPQLPDPLGWDVNATYPKVLADDWQCTETGPVTDIHLWGSWEFGAPGEILSVHTSIHRNIPATPDAGSRPGELLWERDFFTGGFTILDPWGTGDEGWYDPNSGEFRRPDHQTFHQINIQQIPDPFIQNFGEIYWLDISVTVADIGTQTRWGWKTSLEHFMDDAVWGDFDAVGGVTEWSELYDPETGVSLDMAFVITPAPGTLALLGFGGLAALRRRR